MVTLDAMGCQKRITKEIIEADADYVLALNLLKREGTKKRGIRGKQKNAGWKHPHLLLLLAMPPN